MRNKKKFYGKRDMELGVRIVSGVFARTSVLCSVVPCVVWVPRMPTCSQVLPLIVTSLPGSGLPLCFRDAHLSYSLIHSFTHSFVHSFSFILSADGHLLEAGPWAVPWEHHAFWTLPETRERLSSSPFHGRIFLFWLANPMSESFHLTKSLLVWNSLSPHISISPFPRV